MRDAHQPHWDKRRQRLDGAPETINRIRIAELSCGSKHRDGFNSFYPAKAIPDKFHSRSYVNRKGKTYSAPTIDDVIRWAQTEKGAKQIMAGRDPMQPTFDFITRTMDSFDADDQGRCNSNIGFCE